MSSKMIKDQSTARDYAKKNIKEVKRAQEQFLDAISQAQSAFMSSTSIKGNSQASELNDKAMDYIRSNLASGYELAEKLVDATDVTMAVEIQNEYIREQMENYTKQAQELSDLIMANTKK